MTTVYRFAKKTIRNTIIAVMGFTILLCVALSMLLSAIFVK